MAPRPLGSTRDHRPYNFPGLPRHWNALGQLSLYLRHGLPGLQLCFVPPPLLSDGLLFPPRSAFISVICHQLHQGDLLLWRRPSLQELLCCPVSLSSSPGSPQPAAPSQSVIPLVPAAKPSHWLLPPSTLPLTCILALLLGIPPWLLPPSSLPWPCLSSVSTLRPLSLSSNGLCYYWGTRGRASLMGELCQSYVKFS